MESLKPREARILDFIKKSTAENGFPPTVRDICSGLDIKSTSTVHTDIKNLTAKGYLRKNEAGKRRALAPTGDSANAVPKPQTDVPGVINVPLVGNVAAGQPILAEQNIEDRFPMPPQFAKDERTFLLKVRGESMIEAGIFDGDYIIVEQQKTANNGDIVVACIDGFESEATVKTFYHEGDHIRLQPENSSMSPIIVQNVAIQGVVKGVFRYF